MTEREPARSYKIGSSTPIVEQRPSEVIYQVYPASFADGNNDGHGDLKGITSKLDYIKKLGVDAIWISPFYKTPMGPEGDGGYAVSDYRAIGEQFGTMDDFEKLLKEAHDKKLRVYIDFVLAHTSSDHEWFQKSRNREPGFEDRYVWRDGYPVEKKPGEQPPPNWRENKLGEHWTQDEKTKIWTQHYPPNNWKSVFGGSAWEWDEKREQYYLHHFLKTQPANNLNLPQVQENIVAEMKFWLDKGVDGFRLDALPFANYDPQLRHNSWMDGKWPRSSEGWNEQKFEYSVCQTQTVDLVKRLRELADSYPEKRTMLGEVICGPFGGGGSIPIAAKYTQPQTGVDMCYTDALSMGGYPSQAHLKGIVSYVLDTFPQNGGHCNAVDNHDSSRSATRMLFGVPEQHRDQAQRQLLKLFATLPGSFSMLQGQELGLPQARIPEDIPYNLLKDPEGIRTGTGRDGSRTPMPWNGNEKNAGYSTSDTPYLPVPASHYPLAVNMQEADANSLLNYTRNLLAWRKEQPALVQGQTRIIDNQNSDIFAMLRQSDRQTMLCLFNMSGREQSFKPADHLDPVLLERLRLHSDDVITVRPYDSSFQSTHHLVAPQPTIATEPVRPANRSTVPQLSAAI